MKKYYHQDGRLSPGLSVISHQNTFVIAFPILVLVVQHIACGIVDFWSHIAQFCHEDLDSGLKVLTKLTNNHISLTSYSVMKVCLAAQVLSETVGSVLNQFGPHEAAGTAKFCL